MFPVGFGGVNYHFMEKAMARNGVCYGLDLKGLPKALCKRSGLLSVVLLGGGRTS
jgi:hypothetical protein